MTLLELYIRDFCPNHKSKLRFSPSKYIAWLESIVYKFIQQHKDAQSLISNLPEIKLDSAEVKLHASTDGATKANP